MIGKLEEMPKGETITHLIAKKYNKIKTKTKMRNTKYKKYEREK